ncbi:MAG: 2-oxoacid:acceptor oxidoreductase family protein [Oscillospiraceae bacterium]|jgi:2-oxoglutarate ferredoxin oxidoreductase subunit gamma|nr:2-oxoacid:acceptor oxidoreductase family protein [Oscillospiraceae bacterium]
MEHNIVIAGFGGQGVLFTGKVIAYCGLIDGREVSWLPSYGPEMRGGTANCGVCLSERAIGSPLVTAPNMLIAMNTPSFEKFISAVVPGGIVIYDSSLVVPQTARGDVKTFAVPSTQLSNDEHLEGIANIILLGKALKEAAFTTLETIDKAIRKCVPARKEHLIKHNLRAIELGMGL